LPPTATRDAGCFGIQMQGRFIPNLRLFRTMQSLNLGEMEAFWLSGAVSLRRNCAVNDRFHQQLPVSRPEVAKDVISLP